MPTTKRTSKATVHKIARGLALRVPVAPVPASRPRVTRWGTYYTKTYKQYMADTADVLPKAPRALEGRLDVRVEFVCHKPKTTKRLTPRGDIDNHLKAILDALTKAGYWPDDDNIDRVEATKRWVDGKETPHTYIEVRTA